MSSMNIEKSCLSANSFRAMGSTSKIGFIFYPKVVKHFSSSRRKALTIDVVIQEDRGPVFRDEPWSCSNLFLKS